MKLFASIEPFGRLKLWDTIDPLKSRLRRNLNRATYPGQKDYTPASYLAVSQCWEIDLENLIITSFKMSLDAKSKWIRTDEACAFPELEVMDGGKK